MNHPLRCRCGKVQGIVTPAAAATRALDVGFAWLRGRMSVRVAVATAVLLMLVAVAPGAQAQARAKADDGRRNALQALGDADVELRAGGLVWFVENGNAADDKAILPLLGDEDPRVRELAEQGLWLLWSRSGDKAIDAQMTRGAEQMSAREFRAAIATYSDVIRRRPAFAEAWNKRATVYFLAGDLPKSLADCDEVLKRNPYHFGALSGYGQIYFQQKRYDKAIEYWRRAQGVNPNLAGLAGNIEMARKLRDAAARDAI